MNHSIFAALRILSHFWLEEIKPDDVATIAVLPELADTLLSAGTSVLTDLAVEHQRLFGFNLPPYESIFVDPSAMLQAPATARVQTLYREAGWTPPPDVRVGAPDHVGLELLALAEIQAKALVPAHQNEAKAMEASAGLAHQLHTAHLALWVPAFILTLRRLNPHPFYAALADLTLDLLLTTLPLDSQFTIRSRRPPTSNSQFTIHNSQFTIDPFPVLPPAAVYDPEGRLIPPAERTLETGLRATVRRLLTPCESGVFLTREDMARIGRALELPGVMGDRAYMLETLFRLTGEYELVPALIDHLSRLFDDVAIGYQDWAEEYPAWTYYAQAWLRRVTATQVTLNISGETS
jgi:TorA maturation chaperone TorD